MDCKLSLVAVVACALLACLVGAVTDPTTSSTTHPETTTFKPSPSPITTLPTTSTSEAPSTTPAPVPTTTVAPPSDGRGNWTVSNDNVTCIIAEMIVSAKISYPLETANKTGSAEIVVPASAKATGVCSATSQNVTITWQSNKLSFIFGKNDTTKVYFINYISLSVFADNKTFPNISSKLVGTTLYLERKSLEFKTNLNQSYRCIREESLPLSKLNSTSNDAVLVLNKVQLQAFHDKHPAVFGDAQDCELDTPDIVPIAVGCALAALVAIVLVAYLVGRRRSRALGYLSM